MTEISVTEAGNADKMPILEYLNTIFIGESL